MILEEDFKRFNWYIIKTASYFLHFFYLPLMPILIYFKTTRAELIAAALYDVF